MRPKLFLIAFLSMLVGSINAQERFDKEIETISEQLHSQLISHNIKVRLGSDSTFYKVALVTIENEDNKNTKLTDLLENELAVDLAVSSNGEYNVLDRNYIDKLLKEKNIPKDYGNKKDFAKNLGRLKAANLMIVGKLSNFDNEYKIIFTILETSEGATVSGTKGKITATEILRKKNDEVIQVSESPTNNSSTAINNNGASNISRSSNISEAKTIDPNCEQKKTGTCIFENRSNYKLQITIFQQDQNSQGVNEVGKVIVGKKESNPTMGVAEGSYSYFVYAYDDNGSIVQTTGSGYASGSILIVKCKETTIVIK